MFWEKIAQMRNLKTVGFRRQNPQIEQLHRVEDICSLLCEGTAILIL